MLLSDIVKRVNAKSFGETNYTYDDIYPYFQEAIDNINSTLEVYRQLPEAPITSEAYANYKTMDYGFLSDTHIGNYIVTYIVVAMDNASLSVTTRTQTYASQLEQYRRQLISDLYKYMPITVNSGSSFDLSGDRPRLGIPNVKAWYNETIGGILSSNGDVVPINGVRSSNPYGALVPYDKNQKILEGTYLYDYVFIPNKDFRKYYKNILVPVSITGYDIPYNVKVDITQVNDIGNFSSLEELLTAAWKLTKSADGTIVANSPNVLTGGYSIDDNHKVSLTIMQNSNGLYYVDHESLVTTLVTLSDSSTEPYKFNYNVYNISNKINEINKSLEDKVDKVEGYGLSKNDFTDDYKTQVDSNTTDRHNHTNKNVLDQILNLGGVNGIATLGADGKVVQTAIKAEQDSVGNTINLYYQGKTLSVPIEGYTTVEEFLQHISDKVKVITGETITPEELDSLKEIATAIITAQENIEALQDALNEILISNVPTATADTLGVVKIGDGLDISEDGTLSLYNQIVINSFTNDINNVALGSTVNQVVLNWNINKTPIILTLDDSTIDASSTTITLDNQNIVSNKTFTLKASDGKKTAVKTTSINFMNYVLYGVGSSFAENNLTKVLSNTKSRTLNVNAGSGQYIYYSIPARLGTPTFYVGGFEGGFKLLKTYSWNNGTGYSENYNVYQSTNANLGQTTVEVK